MKGTRVWDIPLRLFHWSLAILVGISLYTGFIGGFDTMDYHMLSGYGILALILFRISWGIAGTKHARFTDFVPGPSAVMQYLRNFGKSDGVWPGHNPLGALSVIAILLILLIQASTGLFTNDDILLEGPLAHLVSYEVSREITGVHKLAAWGIAGLAGLHILAILFYQVVKRAPLIVGMITGRLPVAEEEGVEFSWVRELVVGGLLMAVFAGIVYGLVNFL